MSGLAKRQQQGIAPTQIGTQLQQELTGSTTGAGATTPAGKIAKRQPKALTAPQLNQTGFDDSATTLQGQISAAAANSDALTGAIVGALNTKADMNGHAIASAVMGAPQRTLDTASDALINAGLGGGGAVDTSGFFEFLDGVCNVAASA